MATARMYFNRPLFHGLSAYSGSPLIPFGNRFEGAPVAASNRPPNDAMRQHGYGFNAPVPVPAQWANQPGPTINPVSTVLPVSGTVNPTTVGALPGGGGGVIPGPGTSPANLWGPGPAPIGPNGGGYTPPPNLPTNLVGNPHDWKPPVSYPGGVNTITGQPGPNPPNLPWQNAPTTGPSGEPIFLPLSFSNLEHLL